MITQANLITWAFAWTVLFLIVIMQWNGKLPSAQSIQEFFAALNSKGSNIMVLLGLVVYFFVAGIKFIYWTSERIAEGKLTPDNAMVGLGFNWISGAAFGMVLSAMLKAMTGDSGRARTTDIVHPDSTVTTRTTFPAPSKGHTGDSIPVESGTHVEVSAVPVVSTVTTEKSAEVKPPENT